MRISRSLLVVAGLILVASVATAQTPAREDHRAVVEIGAAGEHGLAESSSSVGASVAVEMTPIENWLEVELGVTTLRGAGGSEYSDDLLFKKPWQLSPTVEFMAGAGPQFSRQSGTGGAQSLAAEFVGDFMFWPTKNVGWYLEPSYSFTSWTGGNRSVGMTAGLIIGVPARSH